MTVLIIACHGNGEDIVFMPHEIPPIGQYNRHNIQ